MKHLFILARQAIQLGVTASPRYCTTERHSDYSELAQEIKMRKAAMKEAKRLGLLITKLEERRENEHETFHYVP